MNFIFDLKMEKMEKLPKDILFLLGLKLDSSTIKNFSLANKVFYKKISKDDNFWRNKLKHDYPFLEEFKEKRDWKYFYLEMSFYIYILYKNFEIPYIAVKGYNPKDFYFSRCKNSNKTHILNLAMFYAAGGGDINMVNYLIDKGATNINWAMMVAGKGNHIDIVNLMIEKGANKFDFVMAFSARKGNLDIVKLMIEKGATNFNWTKMVAKDNGHLNIVHYLESL